MARTGMATVISQLRGLTEAGTADYSVGAVTYWTDDQLQTALDYNRIDVRHAMMDAFASIGTANVQTYTEYQIGWQDWESDPVIQDADGNTAGTADYTFDSQLGVVTFNADTGGSVYYITGHAFDLNGAAARVWNSKAAHYAVATDFSTDNMSVKRSQIIQNCKQMAASFAQLSNAGSIYMERHDN